MSFLINFFTRDKKTPIIAAEQKEPSRKSFSPFGFTTGLSGARASWSDRDYAAFAREGYRMNPVVYACVRMIADGAARIPALLAADNQTLSDHPILALLTRPNADQGGYEFFQSLYGHLLMSGSAYAHILTAGDRPRELYALRPDRMRVVVEEDGSVSGYDYGTAGKTKRLSPDTIAPIKFFAPDDDYYGVSPFEAAARAIDIHNEATIFQKSLLENAARPSGCLIYGAGREGANLTEEQFTRLKSELRESYSGAARAGTPMVLEGGLEWKSMGFSPADMEFSDLRHGAAREIALAFGVPPMALGIPGDNTYSNYQEAMRVFARQTLIPITERVFGVLSRAFSRLTGENITLYPDTDSLPALLPEREAYWRRVADAPFLTDAEKRALLL